MFFLYFSYINQRRPKRRFIPSYTFTIQGICGSGHFTFNPVVSTERRRSYQRLRSTDDPKGGFGIACFLFRQWSFNSCSSLSLDLFFFSVAISVWQGPHTGTLRPYPSQSTFSDVGVWCSFYLLVYFHFNWFFSEAVLGCWWSVDFMPMFLVSNFYFLSSLVRASSRVPNNSSQSMIF